ncbi:hypothetical protein CYMTET_47356 [Cymbomonas tetramitiformis]|uniref:Uncharacterized protein n=1 Tax=Cymbomonas tetramitiformis TaxID=36881 RepID=A0AAE0BVR6_9CHLO|nr:hypothetical protein CYMTET_47356 [Cymbomonas tetramitiformis]
MAESQCIDYYEEAFELAEAEPDLVDATTNIVRHDVPEPTFEGQGSSTSERAYLKKEICKKGKKRILLESERRGCKISMVKEVECAPVGQLSEAEELWAQIYHSCDTESKEKKTVASQLTKEELLALLAKFDPHSAPVEGLPVPTAPLIPTPSPQPIPNLMDAEVLLPPVQKTAVERMGNDGESKTWRDLEGHLWWHVEDLNKKIKNLSNNTYATFRKELADAVSTVKQELCTYFASPEFAGQFVQRVLQAARGQSASPAAADSDEVQTLRRELQLYRAEVAHIRRSVSDMELRIPSAVPKVETVKAIRRTEKRLLNQEAHLLQGQTLDVESARYLLFFRRLVEEDFISFDTGSVRVKIPQTASAAMEQEEDDSECSDDEAHA